MQKLDQDQPQDGGPPGVDSVQQPPLPRLTCSIVAWSEGGTAADGFVIEAPTLVRTTAELDAWIEKTKTILSDSDGVQVVPIMDFGLRYLSTPFPPTRFATSSGRAGMSQRWMRIPLSGTEMFTGQRP